MAHPETLALKAEWNCGANLPPPLNPDTLNEEMLSEGGERDDDDDDDKDEATRSDRTILDMVPLTMEGNRKLKGLAELSGIRHKVSYHKVKQLVV